MKYRKKPIVIEAIQWNENNIKEVMEFLGSEIKSTGNVIYSNKLIYDDFDKELKIVTLEGLMRVDKNDYIIKGIKGEYYPCKPDIFEETYEVVESKPLYEFCISARSGGNKIKELYIIIKSKRDNAQFDYENNLIDDELDKQHIGGQLCAYNDILSLMEKMFEVEENGKS